MSANGEGCLEFSVELAEPGVIGCGVGLIERTSRGVHLAQSLGDLLDNVLGQSEVKPDVGVTSRDRVGLMGFTLFKCFASTFFFHKG